jgi:hypothetical protein
MMRAVLGFRFIDSVGNVAYHHPFRQNLPRSLAPGHALKKWQGQSNATAPNKLASIDIPGFLFHGIIIR